MGLLEDKVIVYVIIKGCFKTHLLAFVSSNKEIYCN